MKVPIGGGVPTQLVSATEGWARGLVVKDGNVYWDGDGIIWMVSADGGTPETLAVAATTNPIGEITADTTSVYWAQGVGECQVMKTPLGGGTSSTLGSFSCGALVVYAVAVDSTAVYWAMGADEETGLSPMPVSASIMKVPIGGGTPTEITELGPAIGEGAFGMLAVDETSLYWTDSAAGTVNKLLK